jgi:hypothetical protein
MRTASDTTGSTRTSSRRRIQVLEQRTRPAPTVA